ncbi:sphingosine-1-phosphate transporter SPNS2-like [Hippocampus zosterae]|uniref:sphingosine-1-phosphate transporter SPNS2-like n=1 Tax=Hippocampus zosterae TaxID=109293 RepID=UPI00223E021D|nr:sphingosine-1-phosphate transporter SPNS2-like [Hippocampus zosterae]
MASDLTLFVFMHLLNMLINMDHGIVPAATVSLRKTFDIGEQELGMLGSAVFLGIVVMGVFAGRAYQLVTSKWVLLGGLLLMQASLVLFVATDIFALAMLARFLAGVFQVFELVFFPVWIDLRGGPNKTLWLTCLQVGIPLGIFVGYGMTSFIVGVGWAWQWAFAVQITLVLACILVVLAIPRHRLNIRGAIFDPAARMRVVEGRRQKRPGYFYLLRVLFRSRIYVLASLTFSVLLFVSTGIQFWLTDYFINVLHVPQTTVNVGYVTISITAPTIGTVFGGFIMHQIGGYDSPLCIYFVNILCSIGMLSACVIPFVDHFIYASLLLWIVLFFGGSMVPGLTGLILGSVRQELRSFANSNAETLKNLLGYFPSPFLYGFITSATKWDRAGITLNMYWGMLAPLLLSIGCVLTFFDLKGGEGGAVGEQIVEKKVVRVRRMSVEGVEE